MKHLVVLFALLSCAFAQNMVAMYAGTNNGTTWTPPVLEEDASPPTCTPGSVTAYGVYFDYNVTTAGVFHVAVMTEGSFTDNVEVFAYTHPFDPNAPCTNIIIKEWEKEIGDGGGPVIADFAYMGVGRYWFVVTSNTADTVGQIAIHVYPPLATGMIDAASPVWDSAYGAGTCTGGPASGGPHFGLFTWTQNGTGQYDIVAGWYNASDTSFSYTYLALYSGAQAATAITTDSCANYLYADYDGSNGVTLWNQTLTNGQQYTLVTSPEYDDEYGYWGIWVRPSIAGVLWDTPAWNQPERDSNCTASTSYTTTSWFAEAVVATGQVTIIDTQTLPSSQDFSYIDTYSWFFRGNQSTSSPPPTCGGRIITYGDTGDVTPVYGVTIPTRVYTVVVSTYSGSNSVGNFGLFTMSGTPIGNIPASDETTGDGADGGDGGDGEDEDEDGGDGEDEDDGAVGVSVSILLTAVLAIFARFF